MNTNTNEMNMKELNLDEMEQINGGNLIYCWVRHLRRCVEQLLEDDD